MNVNNTVAPMAQPAVPSGLAVALQLASWGYAVYPAHLGPENAAHDPQAITAAWAVQSDAPVCIATPDCAGLLHAARRLPVDTGERNRAIDMICQYAAALPPVDRETVIKALKEYTGINIGTLRAAAAGSGRGGEPDHLELAHATLAAIGPVNLLFAESYFFRWHDGVWRKTQDKAIKREVQSALQTQGCTVTSSKVDSVTSVLSNDIYQSNFVFNRGNRDTVNCLNCELELTATGWHWSAHRRELYRTTQIPVSFDPNADAPLFWAFLHDVFRDDPDRDDKVRAVLELIGYTLMNHADHEKFVLLIGKGSNGKSVLLHVVEHLCGLSNVAGVNPAQFDNKWQRAHLHMKLANIVTELPQGSIIADAELKAITSGELTTVENKGKDPFDMRAFATCWFGTNHMPHTRDFSDALFRRATILTFNRRYADHEQDKNLIHKLTAELPGILRYALHYYACAVATGFTTPPSSIEAKDKWRREADQALCFIDECCERDPFAQVRLSELYRVFDGWARMSGVRNALGKSKLAERLENLGFERKKSDAIWIQGLKITQL